MKTEKRVKICGTEIERKGPGCKPKYCRRVPGRTAARASQRKNHQKEETKKGGVRAMHKLAPGRAAFR